MPQTEKSPSPHNIGKGHRGLLHKTGNITWTELMFKGRDKHEFLSYSHLQRVFIFQQHALYPWCADKGSTTDFPNIYIYKFYCFKNIATQFTNNDKTYKNHCCLQCRRPQFDSWVWEIPWRRDRLPTPGSWASLVVQMVKNPHAMQETWVRFLGWEDPLEEGMAAHSSILAWRIPWTEEPGGLQSMGSQRVRHI